MAINTWTGAVSDDWNNPANWTFNSIPAAGQPVIIPAGLTNEPTILSGAGGYLTGGANINGTLTVSDNSLAYLQGAIVNAGAIMLVSAGNTTDLRVAGGQTATLTGGGSVLLQGQTAHIYFRDADQGTGKLVNVDNNIQGGGNVGNGQLAFDNQAAGVIDATSSSGLTLQPNSAGFTNEGLIEATGGGLLTLYNGVFTQSGAGRIVSGAGSSVSVYNATISGGVLTSSADDSFYTASGQTGVLNGVTLSTGSYYNGRDNSATYLEGSIVNHGSIVLVSAGDTTELRVGGGQTTTLTGGGSVLLQGQTAHVFLRDNDQATGKLINVDNTIKGGGNIGNGELALDNQAAGIVDATSSSGLTLQPNGAGFSNEGVLEATGGGAMLLSAGAFTQSGAGQILASGAASSVALYNGATIVGGTLNTNSGGSIDTAASQTAILNGVTISSGSTYIGSDNSATYLEGTVVNQGSIALNSGGNTTDLRVAGGQTLTLTGGGSVLLQGQTAHLFIRDADQATGKLINVDNKIQGGGNIGNGQLALDNQANGVIDATSSSGLTLQPNGAGFSNEGLMEATSGGVLTLNGGVFTQMGAGEILASGAASSVNLYNSATIVGGVLVTSSNGSIDSASGQTGILKGVTISSGSVYGVTDNSASYLEGTIVNHGTIALNSTGNTTDFRLAGGQTTKLTGGGTVLLQGQSAHDFIHDADLATGELINVDNNIQGGGNIGNGQMALDNQAGGVIDATAASGLTLQPNGAGFSNEGLIEATGGGSLALNGGVFTQSSAGQMLASGAGSLVALYNGATISGGVVTTSSGGSINTASGQTGTLNGVTIATGGVYAGQDNSDTILKGALVIAGALQLNGGGNTTALQLADGTTLSGGGSVALNGARGDIVYGLTNNGMETITNVDDSIVGGGSWGASNGFNFINQSGGLVEATNANAALTLGASTVNNGVLEANGGTLVVNKAVTGTGKGVITGNGELQFLSAFNENVQFLGAGVLSLSQAYTGSISGFHAGDNIILSGVTNNYSATTTGGAYPSSFTLAVNGNNVTQTNSDGSKMVSRFNVTGQSYTTIVRTFDAAGDLTAVEHEGVTGTPYTAYTTLYSGPGTTGNIVSGNELFYTGQASGLSEIDLDGSNNLLRALYAYSTTAPGTQTGFEADYVAGELAGGVATYLAPSGAPYSTFAVEYDNNYQYVGAVYTYNYTGQTYDEAQYSYTAGAQPKLTEATFSGYTGAGGPNIASFFYDNTGAAVGSQYSYAGIIGQAYTSDTLLYNSSNVLIAAQYSGYTNKPFSSQTTFYNASGVAQEIVRDFTSPALAGSINGQAYNAYEKILNPAFTVLATAYHLDNGGNVYIGTASNVNSPSFGGTGVSANAAELSNTLTGGDWTITGGGTGETFNFASFFNQAEITDYGAAFGGATDVVSVSTQDFANWQTMLADAASSGGGANTTFTSTTTGDKLTLDGVTLSQLQLLTTNQASADFLFHA